jgi:hypothetical protein
MTMTLRAVIGLCMIALRESLLSRLRRETRRLPAGERCGTR